MHDKDLLFESGRLGIARQAYPHHAIPEIPYSPRIMSVSALAITQHGTDDIGYRLAFRRFSAVPVHQVKMPPANLGFDFEPIPCRRIYTDLLITLSNPYLPLTPGLTTPWRT